MSVDSALRPRTVWRVQYEGNTGCVLTPRDQNPSFESKDDFSSRRDRHLHWDRSLASPFVSVFSNKDHAVRWGSSLNATTLYEIHTRGLPLMFRGLQADEYLILGAIPNVNVSQSLSVTAEADDLQRARLDRERSPDRRCAPWRVYNAEAEGWYTDEEDAYEDIDNQHLIEYYMNH